jgi:hypothetical protein
VLTLSINRTNTPKGKLDESFHLGKHSTGLEVGPEEVDERVFLFGVETCPDGGSLAAVACPEVNCFDQNLLSWLRLVSFVRLL